MNWGFDEKGFWLTNILKLLLLLWVLLEPNQIQDQTNCFFCSLTSFFSMLVTCLSSVTQLSIAYSYILWNQLCGLGLVQPIWDARGLAWTLELKDRLSDWEIQEVCFAQSFMLNLVLTVTQTIWFFEVKDLNDMSLIAIHCSTQHLYLTCQSYDRPEADLSQHYFKV